MMTNPSWLVLPAAGSGSRMGHEQPKQYIQVAGKTLIEHTVDRWLLLMPATPIMIALAADDEIGRQLFANYHNDVHLCIGGTTRAQSVFNATNDIVKLSPGNPWIWVHDAARPIVGQRDVQAIQQALLTETRGVILAQRSVDTLKRVVDGRVKQTLDREYVWRALTPQVARAQLLSAAYTQALSCDTPLTDEASALEALGHDMAVVEAREPGIKVTYPSDLAILEAKLCSPSE